MPTASLSSARMAKLITPANVLLAFSALCTFAGLLGLFFGQAYLDLISVNPAVASPREILLFQLMGYFLLSESSRLLSLARPALPLLQLFAAFTSTPLSSPSVA